MRPILIELILLAKVHDHSARLLEGEVKVDEVEHEVTYGVENYVLSQQFWNFHRLLLLLLGVFLSKERLCQTFSKKADVAHHFS